MILSKFKLASREYLIPKRLRPVFEFVWKYWPSFSFYMCVTTVQFFTKTRLGYWLYCSTIFLATVQLDAVRLFLIVTVITASLELAAIRSSPKLTAFFEKRLKKGIRNNIIKDSPVWIMINAFKPLFFVCLLGMLISYIGMHQISQINRFLLRDYMGKWEFSEEKQTAQKVVYDLVHWMAPRWELKGGVLLLKSELLQLDYLSFFLLSILMVIVALWWLREKK